MNQTGSADFCARRVFPILASVAIAGTWTPALRAEFTVGAEIPAFSLLTADGQAVELLLEGGKLAARAGGEEVAPKAFIVHLLQPDCLQCRAQLQALKPVAERYRDRGVITIGIAHRGTSEAARKLVQDLGLPFPVAIGVDSDIAARFAAGDTLGIADATGVVRFAQVGYGEGDAKVWEQALDELTAGRTVTRTGIDRERLAVGDRLPAIHLASLRTRKPMALVGEGGRLAFRDENGQESHPKAAVGMFSRY